MFSVSLPPKQLSTTSRLSDRGAPMATGIIFASGPSATRPAPASEMRRNSRREIDPGMGVFVISYAFMVGTSARVVGGVLRQLVQESADAFVELGLARAVEGRRRDGARRVAHGVQVEHQDRAVLRGELHVEELRQ